MEEATRLPLVAWESFYVIVGSSGAALTGLQFVVIALVAESTRRSTMREIDAFGSPNVVHFSSVLLISAIMSAPWQSLWNVVLALKLSGIAGMFYGAVIIRRARRVKAYQPVFEDWLFHIILPITAYLLVIIAGLIMMSRVHLALFIVGASSLLLLFVGIHNAWDTVTFIAVRDFNEPKSEPEAVAPDDAQFAAEKGDSIQKSS
jgi:hypothetical protein